MANSYNGEAVPSGGKKICYAGGRYDVPDHPVIPFIEGDGTGRDIFMQLWRNPGAFDASRGNMAAWLAVIARHRAIDALRRRRPEDDIEDIVVSVEPDLASEADRSRAMNKVRGALGEMTPPQRSALEMAYFEGLTHAEIADKTGEPLGTIKTRIRTGLLSLRKALAA